MRAHVSAVLVALLLAIAGPVWAGSALSTDGSSVSVVVYFRIVIPARIDTRALDPEKPVPAGQQRRVEHLAVGRTQITVSSP